MVMPQTSPVSVPDKGHREFQMVTARMPNREGNKEGRYKEENAAQETTSHITGRLGACSPEMMQGCFLQLWN